MRSLMVKKVCIAQLNLSGYYHTIPVRPENKPANVHDVLQHIYVYCITYYDII